MEKILEQQQKDEEIRRIFEAYDDDMDGKIQMSFIIDELDIQGLKILEEKIRFKEIREFIKSLDGKKKAFISLDDFTKIMDMKDGDLIKRALLGKLIVPDFLEFTESIKNIFSIVEGNTGGNNASYIPQLAEVDPNLFAIAACTVDGQQ